MVWCTQVLYFQMYNQRMMIAVVVNHLNHSKELYIHTLCEILQCSLNSDFFDAQLLAAYILLHKWCLHRFYRNSQRKQLLTHRCSSLRGAERTAGRFTSQAKEPNNDLVMVHKIPMRHVQIKPMLGIFFNKPHLYVVHCLLHEVIAYSQCSNKQGQSLGLGNQILPIQVGIAFS